MGKHMVVFQPEGVRGEGDPGTIFQDAANQAGVYINSLCGGEGACGRCRVQISRGRTHISSHNVTLLSLDEINAGFVLACQTEVRDDLEVWVPPEARLEGEQILTAGGIVQYGFPQSLQLGDSPDIVSLSFMPLTQKLCLSLPEPSLSENISDLDRLYREMRKKIQAPPYPEISLSTLRGLARLVRESRWEVTATLHHYSENCLEVLSLEPGDSSAENYGIACDIGTTTIAAQLVDLHSGAVLGVEASHNQQVDAMTVLVAVDFSECCRFALRRAMSLLAQPLGRLVLLHVIDSDFVEQYLRQQQGERDQIRKGLFLRAKSELREFVHEEGLSAQNVNTLVCQGIPFLEINKKAVEYQADVVVLGTCGKNGGMNSIFFGDTAEKVLRFITRPVLCVPPDTDHRPS